MPRKARIDAPGALHHIVMRGIERKAIFKDGHDYRSFLDRMGALLTESSTACFAWALMPNHVHLLLRTGLTSISTVMRRLLTGHAVAFNKRHKRYGHLFQNRYKSFLCEEDAYLLELVRHIHLNPLRAGIVSDLKGRRPDLVGGGLVRSIGGWSALKDLRETNRRIISDERILGSSEFAESVLKSANEAYERRTAAVAKGLSIEQVIKAVAMGLELDPESIEQKGRKRSIALARAIVCTLAVDRLMMTGADIARRLHLTPSGVSRLVARGRREPALGQIEQMLFGE